jgi:phage terminase small subunit
MQQFPQVAISRNLLLVLRAYQQEFGMTPSSRSRVVVAADPDTRGDAHRWLG